MKTVQQHLRAIFGDAFDITGGVLPDGVASSYAVKGTHEVAALSMALSIASEMVRKLADRPTPADADSMIGPPRSNAHHIVDAIVRDAADAPARWVVPLCIAFRRGAVHLSVLERYDDVDGVLHADAAITVDAEEERNDRNRFTKVLEALTAEHRTDLFALIGKYGTDLLTLDSQR